MDTFPIDAQDLQRQAYMDYGSFALIEFEHEYGVRFEGDAIYDIALGRWYNNFHEWVSAYSGFALACCLRASSPG